MKWNVYVYNFNANKIETYDIFKSGLLESEFRQAMLDTPSKKDFEGRIEYILRYYFWFKCEWEIILSPWVGRKEPCDLKIDVFQQIKMNWDVFFNYVYDNIKKDVL